MLQNVIVIRSAMTTYSQQFVRYYVTIQALSLSLLHGFVQSAKLDSENSELNLGLSAYSRMWKFICSIFLTIKFSFICFVAEQICAVSISVIFPGCTVLFLSFDTQEIVGLSVLYSKSVQALSQNKQICFEYLETLQHRKLYLLCRNIWRICRTGILFEASIVPCWRNINFVRF